MEFFFFPPHKILPVFLNVQLLASFLVGTSSAFFRRMCVTSSPSSYSPSVQAQYISKEKRGSPLIKCCLRCLDHLPGDRGRLFFPPGEFFRLHSSVALWQGTAKQIFVKSWRSCRTKCDVFVTENCCYYGCGDVKSRTGKAWRGWGWNKESCWDDTVIS